MEDLDALLVDLQASASAHVKSQTAVTSPPLLAQRQQQQQHFYPPHQQLQPQLLHQQHLLQQRQLAGRDSSSPSPPPPVPPHPVGEDRGFGYDSNGIYADDVQPIYEEQRQVGHPLGAMQHQRQQQPQQQQHQVLPPQRQSSSGLGHNLSELDSLLESLNSAQFMAEVEKKNAILQPSPPPNPPKPPEPKSSAASSATKDLDDLMASLSGFHTSPDAKDPRVAPEKPARRMHNSPSPAASLAVSATPPAAPHAASLATASSTAPSTPSSAQFASSPIEDREDVIYESPSSARGSGGGSSGGTPPKPGGVSPKPGATSPKPGVVSPKPGVVFPKPAKPATPLAGVALDSMLNQLGEAARKQGVNTTPKGHCKTCNKLIMGQVVTAMGNTYHPEHFICSNCEKELGTETFFERDGNPFCEECCHFLFSPKCAYCSGPITGKCMSALDKTWHPEHFFCANCGMQFGEQEFHEKNEKVFCRRCFFDLFAARCKACNTPITANYVSALDGQWHNECFTCRECLMPFTGGSYFEHEGQPYCEVHYHARRGSLCAGCQKPITGRCITAMGRKFHPEHFVCSFCLKQLNKGTFKEQSEKPYCHACYGKLFG